MTFTTKTTDCWGERTGIEKSIELVKKTFADSLCSHLDLLKIEAPVFVPSKTGINDDLNGVESPVTFIASHTSKRRYEIVQSLAKWKRLTLAELQTPPGFGIVTDMKAIRPDEYPGKLHSVFVDQWDWERVITKDQRNLKYLKETVSVIYSSLVETERFVCHELGLSDTLLPEKIHFIHSEELLSRYPFNSPKEREDAICRELGAVFVIGVGGILADGKPHDLRAPDYDDWSTASINGYHGFNGDLLVWNDLLKQAFEISSMGIRVDSKALLRQLKILRCTDRITLPWHSRLLKGDFPLTIGGGIGQSRVCMQILRKDHIREIQWGYDIWS